MADPPRSSWAGVSEGKSRLENIQGGTTGGGTGTFKKKAEGYHFKACDNCPFKMFGGLYHPLARRWPPVPGECARQLHFVDKAVRDAVLVFSESAEYFLLWHAFSLAPFFHLVYIVHLLFPLFSKTKGARDFCYRGFSRR